MLGPEPGLLTTRPLLITGPGLARALVLQDVRARDKAKLDARSPASSSPSSTNHM